MSEHPPASRRARRGFVALIATLGLIAAACGDDSDDSTAEAQTTAAPAAPAATEPPAEPAAEPADEPEETTPAATTPATTEAPATDAGADRSDWPEKLVLAAVPAEQDAQLQESYSVTVQILSDELGLPIDFFQAADYAGVIEALIAGRVDLAQFGPFSYVIAIANGADAAPVGVMVGEKDEEPGYQSYLVARADNAEINSLEDVRDTRVCFVDPGSTSGFLVPTAGLLEAGIDPNADVQGIFAGGHDASVISVANGDCDAGFAFDSMVTELLPERGEIEEGEIKIVWESPIIAGSPMAMRLDLPQSLQDEIADIFANKINVDWAAENGYCESNDPILCSFSDEAIWGYVYRDDSFYEGIRILCRELGADQAPQCEGI
jgi:phosphonate transport system substrate-binding protein